MVVYQRVAVFVLFVKCVCFVCRVLGEWCVCLEIVGM